MKLKKILALMMALLMAFQMLPFSAFAEGDGEKQGNYSVSGDDIQGSKFYAVTFRNDDGTENTELVRAGTSVELPVPGAAKDPNVTFEGWVTDKGTDKEYNVGKSGGFKPLSDVTLSARFAPAEMTGKLSGVTEIGTVDLKAAHGLFNWRGDLPLGAAVNAAWVDAAPLESTAFALLSADAKGHYSVKAFSLGVDNQYWEPDSKVSINISIKFDQPLQLRNGEELTLVRVAGESAVEIPCKFDVNKDGMSLKGLAFDDTVLGTYVIVGSESGTRPVEIQPENVSVKDFDASSYAAQLETGDNRAAKKDAAPDDEADKKSASGTKSGCLGFDISVEGSGESKGGLFRVPVVLTSPVNLIGEENAVADSVTLALYHIVEGKPEPVTNVEFDQENGVLKGFTFITDGFSPYMVTYTVEFHNGDQEVVIAGEGQVLLSTLITKLGLTRNDGTAFTVDEVANVTFTTPELFTVQKVLQGDVVTLKNGDESSEVTIETSHDFVITSEQPFEADDMIILLNDDTVIGVPVTDVQESSDLTNFLSNVIITGATQNEQGVYEVEAGKDYSIILSFEEGANYQFDNDGTLTYQMPAGIAVLAEQSEPLVINIVYKGRTYQVNGNFHLGTDGLMSVTFDQTDPDYPRLEKTTDVSFRIIYYAQFDKTENEIKFSEDIERDIIFDDENPGQAYAEKTATYDETTGTFHYTITVTATGDVSNVHVVDTVLGDALIVDTNSVVINGNSTEPTGGMSNTGFDYTFPAMAKDEKITIKYDARVDFSKDTNGDGKITADQTKNTVSVEPENGDPHNSEYSREINFKYTVKKNGTEAGTTSEGDKIIDWEIEYNPLALVAVGGDTITDRISDSSAEYMKYYGDGITVEVYDHSGSLVTTRVENYGNLANYNDSTWTYRIPDGDTTPYKYVIKYKTVVDMTKVGGGGVGVTLDNKANGAGGSIHVAPRDEVAVVKEAESFTTEEVTWNSTLSIPQNGLTSAVVTDTLPSIWIDEVQYHDLFKEDSLEITGLLDGESYEVTYSTGGVVITFYQDAGKTQPGLKAYPGGRDVNVRLTTKVDQEWLQKGYETGGYNLGHTNSININGKTDTATVIFGKPGIEKTLETNGKKSFKYTLTIAGLNQMPLSIIDTFDTSLLEVDTSGAGIERDAFETENAYQLALNEWAWNHMYIFGGNQYDQSSGRTPVSYRDKETGIEITANTVPKQADGTYYPYYKISYYLKLKDGVDLEQLAKLNGGEYDLINTAIWGDHETDYTYKVVYDALTKELLNAGVIGGTNRTAEYKITFNSAKATLNNGVPMEMKDVLSANLSLNYSSIRIETDPAGSSVPYSISGGKDEQGHSDGTTVATYTIPDATAVVITYSAEVRGNGPVKIVNKVSVNGNDKTTEHQTDYGSADEGYGAQASFKIVKVDGYDANKKLSGVKFRVFCNDMDHPFVEGENGENPVYVLELETDDKGEIIFDGNTYKFYYGLVYHVQEIEEPENYGKIGFDYLVTLTNNMALVDYGHYIYYYSDSMQIKNWPLQGLVVEKQVESDDAADKDRYYTFRVSILNADGTVNTNYNEKNGDDQFENGVVEFEIKHGEQKMFWGFAKNTRYKVEEIDANGFATTVTYNTFDENGNITGTITDDSVEHIGELTQENEIIIFKNSKHNPGGLELSKVLISDAAADADVEFTFTVTLNDTTINGTYGDMTFTNGEATVTLKGGESAEATGLPVGITYTITEASATGFQLTGKTGDEGTISTTKSEAVLTNTRDKGDLELSKVLISDAAADATVEFTFTVKLGDTTINGPYGDMTFTDGVATVTLKGGQSAEATGLPTGITYTITEADAPGFQLTRKIGDTGTISTTKSEAEFTNTPIKYCVAVTKKWNDQYGGVFRPESIEVTLKGTITKDGKEKIVYGPKTFALTSKNDWTALVRGVYMYAEGERITYTWAEGDVKGYTLTANIPGTEPTEIEDTTAYITTIENTQQTGSLEITKNILVDGNQNKQNGDKTYFVQISRDEGLKGRYYVASADGRLSRTPEMLEVSTDRKLVISNLPVGQYVVTEVGTDGKPINGGNATRIGALNFVSAVYNNTSDPENTTATNAVTVADNTTGKVEINNNYTTSRYCLAVTKAWMDEFDRDGVRPTRLLVELQRRETGTDTWQKVDLVPKGSYGKYVDTATHYAIFNEENNWTFMEIGELQMNEQGVRYEYRWVEHFEDGRTAAFYPEELRGYTVTQENTDNGLTFVTKLVNVHEPEKTRIPVLKVWNDNNNQDGLRPASVTVRLMKKVGDAAPAEVTRFTLAEADREINSTPWSHVFDNLPKNENGIEIRYSVEEVPVDGYSVRIAEEVFSMTDGRVNGFTITNTHEPKQIDVSVTKVWDDNDNALGVRPAYVRVVLTKDNVPITLNREEYIKIPAAFTSSEADMTSYINVNGKAYYRGSDLVYTWDSAAERYIVTVKGLPAFENGHEISYGWMEDNMANDYGMSSIGRQVVYGTSGIEEQFTTITNKYMPGLFCLTISKVWDDGNDLDGIRPKNVRVQLMADGEIAKYTDGTDVEPIVLNDANNWTGMVLGVPKTKAGVAINYTWKEESVPGYQITSSNTNGLVDANIQSTRVATVTNTHKPDLTAFATIRKIWADDNNAAGMRPSSLTVTLYGNGTEVTKVVLDGNNNWTARVDNLPAAYSGEAITYTWREQQVLSYTQTGAVTADGVTTITNTYRSRGNNITNNYNYNYNNNYTTGGNTITFGGGGLVFNNQQNFAPNMPGEPLIEIEDYGTPLGINVIINHVGDCFD